MASLPADNTARYKVFYDYAGHTHVTQVRAAGVHSPSSFGTWFDGLMQLLSPVLWAVGIVRVEFAPSGSNIFNPVTTGIEGNTYGSGTPVGLLAPQFVSFQGRSSGGHKWRLSIYGIKPEENDFRFELGDNGDVDNAVSYVQSASSFGKAIDGVSPVVYSYANTGFNAYWQRKVR